MTSTPNGMYAWVRSLSAHYDNIIRVNSHEQKGKYGVIEIFSKKEPKRVSRRSLVTENLQGNTRSQKTMKIFFCLLKKNLKVYFIH